MILKTEKRANNKQIARLRELSIMPANWRSPVPKPTEDDTIAPRVLELSLMVIIATINDNSSTLGAIVSSSVGFGTGDLQLAGIIDNSLNLAICLLFALFSVFKIIQFVIKDLESSSAVEEDSAQVS